MSNRFVYDFSDTNIIPLIELSDIDYFIGSDRNVNSSLILKDEVEKTILNDLGEEQTKFFQLEEPKYIGDELTRLNGYNEQGIITETCFINPNDYIDFYRFENVGNEPKLLDFFSMSEIEYFASLPTYEEEHGIIIT